MVQKEQTHCAQLILKWGTSTHKNGQFYWLNDGSGRVPYFHRCSFCWQVSEPVGELLLEHEDQDGVGPQPEEPNHGASEEVSDAEPTSLLQGCHGPTLLTALLVHRDGLQGVDRLRDQSGDDSGAETGQQLCLDIVLPKPLRLHELSFEEVVEAHLTHGEGEGPHCVPLDSVKQLGEALLTKDTVDAVNTVTVLVE